MDESRAGDGSGADEPSKAQLTGFDLRAIGADIVAMCDIEGNTFMKVGLRLSPSADALDILIVPQFMVAQEVKTNESMDAVREFAKKLPDVFLDALLLEVHKQIEARGRAPRAPDWVRAQLEKSRQPNTGN